MHVVQRGFSLQVFREGLEDKCLPGFYLQLYCYIPLSADLAEVSFSCENTPLMELGPVKAMDLIPFVIWQWLLECR